MNKQMWYKSLSHHGQTFPTFPSMHVLGSAITAWLRETCSLSLWSSSSEWCPLLFCMLNSLSLAQICSIIAFFTCLPTALISSLNPSLLHYYSISISCHALVCVLGKSIYLTGLQFWIKVLYKNHWLVNGILALIFYNFKISCVLDMSSEIVQEGLQKCYSHMLRKCNRSKRNPWWNLSKYLWWESSPIKQCCVIT